MFLKVIIFAVAALAVGAQEYSRGHAISSQSITHHQISHDDQENRLQYHSIPSSYHSAPILTHNLEVQPSNHPLLRTTYLTPLSRTASINHQTAPILQLTGPISNGVPVTQAFPVTHQYTPVHDIQAKHHVTAAVTEYAAPTSQYSASVNRAVPTVSIIHRYAPIHAAPVTYHAASTAQGVASTSPYSAPIIHAPLVTQAFPIKQHHVPVRTAIATHDTSPSTQLSSSTLQYVPTFHATPITRSYAPVHVAPVTRYFTPIVVQDTPQNSVPASTTQHASMYNGGLLSYNLYAKGYKVHEPQTDDIRPYQVPRRSLLASAAYRNNGATSSVHVVHYNGHENNGFNAQIHHSEAAAQYYHR